MMNEKKGIMGKIVLALALIAFIPFVIGIEWSTPTPGQFTTVSNNPVCLTTNPAGWLGTSGVFSAWAESNYNCYRADGVNIIGEPKTDCCPSGYFCNESFKCQESEITACSDFKDAYNCTRGTSVGVGDIESVNGAGFCDYNPELNFGDCIESIDCGCSWSGGICQSYHNDAVCKGIGNCKDYSYFLNSSSGIDESKAQEFCSTTGTLALPIGNCLMKIVAEDNCNTTGKKSVVLTTNWSIPNDSLRPSSCQDGTREVPCTAQLGFFGVSGVIILVVLLILFYFILRKKKVKTSERKTGKTRKKRI